MKMATVKVYIIKGNSGAEFICGSVDRIFVNKLKNMREKYC